MKTQDLRQCLALAAPVMLAYISIGIPCGVMEAQVGLTPLMAFLFSGFALPLFCILFTRLYCGLSGTCGI